MKLNEIIHKILTIPNAAFFYTPPIFGKGDSYLFLKPIEIVTIKSRNKVEAKLNRIDSMIKKGYAGYSLINYEAGYLFERMLNKYLPQNEKLIQFLFYDKKDLLCLKSSKITFDEPEKYKVKNFRFNTSKNEFINSIKKIKSYIEEGDTYQVNYTIKGKFDFDGSLSGLLSALIFNQSARYTAFIKNGNKAIVSLSPELFFQMKGRKIISKPMKGTSKRGNTPKADFLIKRELEVSEKNQAENVMIVDLIRNDLGRISEYSSVKAKNLFEVEKYESVYQMISTIEAKLQKHIKLSEVIKNIYPCGSITGAPKIRTMEIINELEKEPRGIYTGSIGLFTKSKQTFSIPIRTLFINLKSRKGEIGLGSGIVWDSLPNEEFEETKLKGKFLTAPAKSFQLVETMLVEGRKIFLLNYHLERLKAAADYFMFNFNEKHISKRLNEIIYEIDGSNYKLRITLDKQGRLHHSVSDLVNLVKPIKVVVSSKRISSQDRFQYFKTTNRYLYDLELRKYSAKGFFDVLFLNEKNNISEGSITNIFIEMNGVIYTPPISAGILNGVYRKYFIDKNQNVKEADLSLNDLLSAKKIILTNSVREEIVVNKLFINEKEFIEFGM